MRKFIVKKLFKFCNNIVMWYMKIQLKNLQKTQDTPYIYIYGAGKDFPNYLMYTDDKDIRAKMHAIY